jgi:hypothetical protein
MWIRAIACAAVLAVPTNAMAADRVVDVSSIEGVAALVREAGYKAEVKTGKDGSTYISSAVNGSGFQLNFYGCKDGKGCESFDFYSWFKKEPLLLDPDGERMEQHETLPEGCDR